MSKTILSFLSLFTLLTMSACKYDSAAPIRDIRFDPKLLGRLQADGPATCTNHFLNERKSLKNLGTISSDYVLVAFDAGLNNEGRQKVAESFGFVEEIVSQSNSRSAMLYTLKLMDGLNCQQTEQAIKELQKDASVRYAAPYFEQLVNGKKQLTGVSNELVVTVDNNSATTFKSLSKTYNAASVTALDNNTYLLAFDKESEGNALEAANYLHQQKGITLAKPEFIVTPL